MPLATLYSFRRCPYAMRARLALQASGFSCVLREVVLRDKPQEMLAISPKGTVPVLALSSGKVIDESLDIMVIALQQADPLGWLPKEEATKTAQVAFLQQVEAEFKPQLDRTKYPDRYPEEDTSSARAKALSFLRPLNEKLALAPWLGGQQAGIADAGFAPFLRQFAHIDRAAFDAEGLRALSSYLDDFLASPVFLSVMRKYPKWQSGDPEQVFPETAERVWERSS